MGEEMQTESSWRKAIAETRDRKQAQVLASGVGTALAVWSVLTLEQASPIAARFPAFVLGSAAVSVAFALVVWMLRAATPAGAVSGGMICLLLTYWTGSFAESIGRTALTPLALLFALTFLATRAGRRRKVAAGLAEGRRGRNAAQVIANLSMAALCVAPWMHAALDWTMKVMCLAALAEATADTVSSEIGQAYGGAPVMLLTLQRVEPGVDGAVTLLGTLTGVAAGLLVAVAGAWSMHLHEREAAVAAAAGSAGLFFDSLLGATVERRGWLGNDLVNFSSTLFAAVLAAALYRLFVL